MPRVAATNPMPMAARVPIFTAMGVIKGVMAMSAPAAGSVANPASNALMPKAWGSWKYRLSTYINPLRTPATIRMASVAPTRARFAKSAQIDQRGSHSPLDRYEGANEATTEMIRHPTVGQDVQPHSLPSLRASTIGTRIPAINTVP